jgi:glycosyltransferase involved in cell wall biosynthesis
MRLVVSLVVHNERDRYLLSFLEWHRPVWDELFVYDDRSTDGTVDLCKRYTDKVFVRPDHQPSFLEHEGKFRRYAWQTMANELELQEGDWVLSLDADEFLVEVDRRYNLVRGVERMTKLAEGRNSVSIHIPEVWELGEPPLVRTDGFWGGMRLPRLCRYLEDDRFIGQSAKHPDPKPMGCGSIPAYAYRNPLIDDTLKILHFGYAQEVDRHARYDRYTGLTDHGHNKKHISSIVGRPTLEPWRGQTPAAYTL